MEQKRFCLFDSYIYSHINIYPYTHTDLTIHQIKKYLIYITEEKNVGNMQLY